MRGPTPAASSPRHYSQSAMIEAAATAAMTVSRLCMYHSSYGCQVPLGKFINTLRTA